MICYGVPADIEDDVGEGSWEWFIEKKEKQEKRTDEKEERDAHEVSVEERNKGYKLEKKHLKVKELELEEQVPR